MKSFILFFALLFVSILSYGQTGTAWVNGYYKSDGTYISGYYKTISDNTNHNNWSTNGNYNPYSSQAGYRAPDYSNQANNYGQGYSIYTGPQGGQYYINSNGNKVYVPKRRGW